MSKNNETLINNNELDPSGTRSPILTLDRAVLTPPQSLWLRASYIKLARDCIKKTYHAERDEMTKHTPYYRNNVLGYRLRGIVYEAATNHANDDGTCDVSRICIAMPRVYDKTDNKWHVIDSHIWIRMNAILKPEKNDARRLAIRIGDTLTFWAAFQGYTDKTGHQRNGLAWWSPERSDLIYKLKRNGRYIDQKAPSQDGWCHDLIRLDHNSPHGWFVCDSVDYEADMELLQAMADTANIYIDYTRGDTKKRSHRK